MIILGGEPPFTETPDPRFGEVIKKFNGILYSYQNYGANFNADIQQKLQDLNADLGAFVTSAIQAVDDHVNAQGAVHGETKSTIGLAKKDNFRTATLQEHIDFAPVEAFVTPEGAKEALQTKADSFIVENYQKNDQFWFASWYHQKKYPVIQPTQVEPVRYLGTTKNVGMLFNADRLVFSPLSDDARYETQFVLTSFPTLTGVKGGMEEIGNLRSNYLSGSWNAMGGKTGDGRIAIFRPLVSQNVYEFANNLGMGGNNFTTLFFEGFGSTLHKGLVVSSSHAGSVLTINHRFFKADVVAADPELENLITGSYTGVFDMMGVAPYSAPVNGSHTIDVKEFMTVPAGTTVSIQGGSHGPVLSLFWNIQDQEIYLHAAIPVRLSLNGVTNDVIVTFIEAIAPGSLVAGGTAVFTMLGTRSKDIFTATLEVPGAPLWTRRNDKTDLLNTVQHPGVMLSSGVVVKASAGKYGVRVKRFPTQYTGIKDWLTSTPSKVDMKRAITTMYAPSRHSPFGPIPERVFPYNHTASTLRCLIYGLNPGSGMYEWREASWMDGRFVSAEQPGVKFGILLPDLLETKKTVFGMPKAIVSKAYADTAGVEITALGFTTTNGFKGSVDFSYSGGVLTPGTAIRLDPVNVAGLKTLSFGVLARAAVANPLVPNNLRELQIQVFAISLAKALVVITDGLCYAEAAVCNYTIANGLFTLSFGGSGLPTFTVVTQPNQPAMSGSRASSTGDNVWMEYSDLLISVLANGNYEFVLTRPFGNLYGDLSFTISGIGAAPTFTLKRMNPGRLYQGVDYFDAVEELHPPLLVPNKGLYQSNPAGSSTSTPLVAVGSSLAVDPYDINEAGWVRIPAGARVVLGGAAYSLEREFSMKLPVTGTHYCYLVRDGERLTVLGSSVKREISHNEICFGIVVNGIFSASENYLVMNNKVMSATRSGSAIPVFSGTGDNLENNFFTERDIS